MAVLGIMMSQADAPEGLISRVAGKFDPLVCDFAWHMAATGGPGELISFDHDVAVGNVTWYHYAQTATAGTSTDDGWLHRFYDSNGALVFAFDMIDGKYRLYLYGSTTENTPSVYIETSLTRYDIKLDFTSGIQLDLYLEGSSTPQWTLNVGSAGSTLKPAKIVLQNYDTDNVWVSELYVADFDTRNTRPIKQIVNAAGNYAQWNGTYAELGDEDPYTVIDTDAGGDKISVNVDAYPGPASPAGIKSVVVKAVASRGATGPQDIDPFVRIAGTDYSAGSVGLVEARRAYFAEWPINPNTGVAWVVADLDTTEIGLESKT